MAVAPGRSRAYDEAEWSDALVVVARGRIELEGLSGARRSFEVGAALWLDGLALRALHNQAAKRRWWSLSRAGDEFPAAGWSYLRPPTTRSPRPLTAETMNDRKRWIALYVLCAGVLMIVIDATIVNVALPSIQDDLGFSQSNLAWVVNAYLIAFGGLLLLAGRVGDLIGQRRIFLVGLAVFTAASLLCAVSQSQGLLIAARFVQGVGGALTSAVILGMIVTMFPEPREQAKAIGVYGFVASAGGSIGLLAGGALTEAINWHWIFFINIPVGIVTAFLATRLVADSPGIGLKAGADLPGAVLLTGGLMLGVYTILQVSEQGWGSTRTLGLGAISIALLAAFVARQARIANPLMPLRLFHSRNVAGANVVIALLVVGMFGMFFLGALYLQRILGYSPLEVGLAFLPSTVVMGTMSLKLSGPLAMRYGPKAVAAREPGLDRPRPAALRADAGRRHVRDAGDARDDLHRHRRRPGLPVADGAGDVGRHAERLGPGLGPHQHERAGRRRHRPRRAGHAGQRAHRHPARGRPLRRRGAQRRLPPRLPDRRGARGRRHRGCPDRAALGQPGRGGPPGRAARRASPRAARVLRCVLSTIVACPIDCTSPNPTRPTR